MMSNSIDFTGQWLGYFDYGPEYGDNLVGEKVHFRIFVDSFKDGQFTGRSVDLEGIGANLEISQVSGFVDGNLISFTKQYLHFHGLDEYGNIVDDKSKLHPIVAYLGEYDQDTKIFAGQWELRMEIQPIGEYWLENICTGKWEISRDS